MPQLHKTAYQTQGGFRWLQKWGCRCVASSHTPLPLTQSLCSLLSVQFGIPDLLSRQASWADWELVFLETPSGAGQLLASKGTPGWGLGGVSGFLIFRGRWEGMTECDRYRIPPMGLKQPFPHSPGDKIQDQGAGCLGCWEELFLAPDSCLLAMPSQTSPPRALPRKALSSPILGPRLVTLPHPSHLPEPLPPNFIPLGPGLQTMN